MQSFRLDILDPWVKSQLKNIRQQSSKLSQANKVLKALLLLKQKNRDPVNIYIMSEAIFLIGEKRDMLQDISRSPQDISRNSTRSYSFIFSILIPSFPIPNDAKQVLFVLIAFGGDLESFSYSQISLISDELSKLKNEIDRHINQSQVSVWDD